MSRSRRQPRDRPSSRYSSRSFFAKSEPFCRNFVVEEDKEVELVRTLLRLGRGVRAAGP